MENGLIIGRNYLDIDHPITENNGQPIKDGEIGQQSEKIWDKGVSRRHLRLTKTDTPRFPYHLELLRLESDLYIDGEKYVSKDINGFERIELGKYRYRINIKNAINDLKTKMNDVPGIPPTEIIDLGTQGKDNPLPPSPSPISPTPYPFDIDSLFKSLNILIVILFLLAIALKSYQTVHIIVLIVLAVAIVCDVYIYIQKQKIKK